MLKKVFLLISIILLVGNLFSQQQNLPLNREFGLVNQKVWNAFSNNVHTSFLPLNESHIQIDTITSLSKSEQKFYFKNLSKSKTKPKNFFQWMNRSLFFENFLVVDTGNFYLTVDPLFNLEIGQDSENNSGETLYKNTRGAIVRANVGKRFSFETSIYENQMVLPKYKSDYANATGVIPGQGRWKNFKTNQGYDFSSASANISYAPNKHFNFQLGTGKNFVGDGYRSLLLSDNSFNYPFIKVITTFGKKNQFQYTKLNASLSSITRREKTSTAEALFQRKTMSTHYFSWLATKWLNIGLFESTLWQTEDSSGTKPLQFQQFNPIIGINTATTGFNDVNHSLVGTNLKIKLPFKTVLYNQFVYDGDSKYGYQFGFKYFGIPNLTLQGEYNSISQYTYSSDVRLQTYSNYNEPLAHSLGANFNEIIGLANYKFKRFFTQLKIINVDIEREEIVPLFAPNFEVIGNSILKNSVNIKTIQIHIGFIINPKNNLSIIIGLNERVETSSTLNHTNSSDYIYFGIRTSLRNLYDDF